MIIEDFQPGDGTRYVMCLAEVAPKTPEATHLGCWLDGGYLLTVANLRVVVVLPRGGYVSQGWLASVVPGINPWTARAIMLWLATQVVDLDLDHNVSTP